MSHIKKAVEMKSKYAIILVLIFLAFSCTTAKTPENEVINSIPLLEISDSIFHNQLIDIIFSSECFTEFQYQRKVFYIFESISLHDSGLISISFLTHCCFEKDDLKNLRGGFSIKKENNTYIFILSNNRLITENVYKLTDSTLNVSDYMGIIEESDAIWHLMDLEGSLELYLNDCH